VKFIQGHSGIPDSGFSNRLRQPYLMFQAFQPGACCLDRRCSRGLSRAGVRQGSVSNASDFVQEFTDLHLQPAATLLNSVQDIALHASAVGFQQMRQKLVRVVFDHPMSAYKAQN
jgi:hypothetical protein